jgi:LmbE family N-acetylglucosaminyl deacetylase
MTKDRKSVVLVIAPHPDDETLGCGGTLLRHLNEGDDVHWLIVTSVLEEDGWAPNYVAEKNKQIDLVNANYGFLGKHQLGFPAAGLDALPFRQIVEAIEKVINAVCPTTLYIPSGYDAHTDHQIVFSATTASAKWFRAQSIKEIYSYETLSETNFSFADKAFDPNVFVNITDYLEKKCDILTQYSTEISEHPFPRSEKAVRALAELRGSQSGCNAAESFQLVYRFV